jgi:signal transduction histidine kinase
LYFSKNLAHKNKLSHQYPELFEHISSTFFQLSDDQFESHFKLTKIPFQNEFDLGKSTRDTYLKLCKLYADSALVISELKNDNRTKISCLNLLGAYYRQRLNDKQAIEYFNKAIELAEQINYKVDIPNYYINIARTYFIIKQYEKAIEYGLKAYQLSVELNILIYKSTSANILRTSFIELKDYKNAMEYQQIEADARAEINSQKNWSNISELDKKYQTQQKQKEIEYQKTLLDLQNTQSFWKNIVIACMLIAFIVILIGIILIQKQKTALVKQKEEIEAQSEKITEQYQCLEKLNHFKESLTQALVHDLKNPLNQIMLKTSNKSVSSAARKMLRLIMNMLDVEKYEHTEFKLSKEHHSLRNVILEVVKGQEISMKEKNMAFRLHFTDYKILADMEVMIRIFDNLLSNAIRYSPLNSSIDVFAEQSEGNVIKIVIRNYGEPIPEQALPFIFDKYRQFGKNESNAHRTTGLGLTFCKMAVEAHGGKIGVNSKPDEGTDFWFTLPFVSKTDEIVEIENIMPDYKSKLLFTETDFELLKQVVKQVKEFEIYEISRFHEVLDPLKETSGNTVNEWISLIFNAINIQNTDEFNRLTKLAENE